MLLWPCAGVTVLWRQRQGKTNALEAIYLTCAGRPTGRGGTGAVRWGADWRLCMWRRSGVTVAPGEIKIPASGRRVVEIAGRGPPLGRTDGPCDGGLFSPRI